MASQLGYPSRACRALCHRLGSGAKRGGGVIQLQLQGTFGVADVTTEAVSYQNFLNAAMPTQMARVSICSNHPAGDQNADSEAPSTGTSKRCSSRAPRCMTRRPFTDTKLARGRLRAGARHR